MKSKHLLILLAVMTVISVFGETIASAETINTRDYWVLSDGYSADFTNSGQITVSYGPAPHIVGDVFDVDWPGSTELTHQFFRYDSGKLVYCGARFYESGSYSEWLYVPNSPQELLPAVLEVGKSYTRSWSRKEYKNGALQPGDGSDSYTTTIKGPYSTKVPAGTFTTYEFRFVDNWETSSGSTGTTIYTYYLAKNIGWVKLIRGNKTYELLQSPTTTSSTTTIPPVSGTTVKIMGGIFKEDVILNTPKTLILEGGYDSTFTSQTSNAIMNSLTIANGTIIADRVVLQPPDITTTTVPPTTTTTVSPTTTTAPTTTTTSTPSGGSEVWVCTEADCSTIKVTFGDVTPTAYLNCGTRMRFYNVPAGTYSYSATGCGITWSGGSLTVNGTSSYIIWLCPPSGYSCCPSGCDTGGEFRCSQCGGSTTSTTSTTTTIPSEGSTVEFCTEASCSGITVDFGGVTHPTPLSCTQGLRFIEVPAGTYSWSASGCGLSWSSSITVDGTTSYLRILCPATDYPCCPFGCETDYGFACSQCP